MHGEDYICLGFLFGEKYRVAYISDVSRIPASTEHGMGLVTFCFLCIFILYSFCKSFSLKGSRGII